MAQPLALLVLSDCDDDGGGDGGDGGDDADLPLQSYGMLTVKGCLCALTELKSHLAY